MRSGLRQFGLLRNEQSIARETQIISLTAGDHQLLVERSSRLND
mgnify:CR=1 FL=1